MNYTKQENTFLSSNGENQIKYYVYVPLGEVRALFQLSHGMCEYVERYEGFIDYLTRQGFLVFGNDHLGHKGSVKSQADLGYMGDEGGWRHMYEDVHTLSKRMKKEYPNLKLFLFGHSMGSFIVRAVMANYITDYDGVILCGTSGTNPMTTLGLKVVSFLRIFKKGRAKSLFVTAGSFKDYNSRYDKVTNTYEWLSRDRQIQEAFAKDPYTHFTFSLAGYNDLFNMLDYISSDNWYNIIPEDIPLFVISGDMDPVGSWGDGIREVDEKLRRKDRKNYDMKLYPDMRHEILNEIGKEEVYEDIRSWLMKYL